MWNFTEMGRCNLNQTYKFKTTSKQPRELIFGEPAKLEEITELKNRGEGVLVKLIR